MPKRATTASAGHLVCMSQSDLMLNGLETTQCGYHDPYMVWLKSDHHQHLIEPLRVMDAWITVRHSPPPLSED